jgi:hypothetical protein
MFTLKRNPTHTQKHPPGRESREAQHKRLERKDFRCYMQLFDHDTQTLVGHLADVSSGGFKLDSQVPIPVNKNIRFRMDLTSEVANKPRMIFVARSRWCKIDPLDPFCYNVGFQMLDLLPEDYEIFNRLIDRYGTDRENRHIDLRRTNKW